MKQFKDYIVEYEISHDGKGNYRDDEGNEWTSKTGGAHRSSFGRRHTITSHQPDHPHSVHINGKKWKTFGSHSHASNVAKKIKGATVHREEVQLDEISDKTLMSYAQKVHDDSLKHDKDPSKRSAVKRNKSVMGFSRALNKLESRPVKESNDHYEEAEEHKNKASKALEISDMEAHHFHMSNHHESMGRWHESKGRHSSADREYAKAEEHHEKSINASKAPSRSVKSTNEEVEQIHELSSDLLARYKEKAGLAATAADKAKKYDLGHKRFKGIMKATFKQFANDAKK